MPDVLIYADTFRSPELRHEVPLGVPDPFLYVEKDGVKHIAVGSMEIAAARASSAASSCTRPRSSACDELIAAGLSSAEVRRGDRARAVKALGIDERGRAGDVPALARRPPPRRRGRADTSDATFFDDRRRVEDARPSSPGSAVRSARPRRRWTPCRELLRDAVANGDGLELDGEPLTVERVKSAMARHVRRARRRAPTTSSSRRARRARSGHDMGSGPIRAGVPIVVDIWPRDNESFMFCDMTRTFVVGDVPDDVARVAPPLQGGARRVRSPRSATAPTAARSSTAPARSSRRPASRRSGRRRRASRSPTASSTGSATASGSRCTSSRAWGSPSKLPLEGGRRRHGRAGLLPAGLRRRPARGPRARDRGRRREPDEVPVRSRRPMSSDIDTLLLEERRYPPPPEFAAQANAQPSIYDEDFEAFWEREGRSGSRGSSRSRSSTSGSGRTRSGSSAAS